MNNGGVKAYFLLGESRLSLGWKQTFSWVKANFHFWLKITPELIRNWNTEIYIVEGVRSEKIREENELSPLDVVLPYSHNERVRTVLTMQYGLSKDQLVVFPSQSPNSSKQPASAPFTTIPSPIHIRENLGAAWWCSKLNVATFSSDVSYTASQVTGRKLRFFFTFSTLVVCSFDFPVSP